MPDFNKGDFTQQGVNGHVNATVRLNEKRLVNIDLTSNEEAEGCTVTGTVTDLLNDKVYGIGTGVSGNIEITENGENINVAPYATATVNISGGGVPLCTLTIVNNRQNDVPMSDVIYANPIIENVMHVADTETIETGSSIYQCIYYDMEDYGACVGVTGMGTLSDLVNCELDTTGDYPVLAPINTDLSSSATITLEGGGGEG